MEIWNLISILDFQFDWYLDFESYIMSMWMWTDVYYFPIGLKRLKGPIKAIYCYTMDHIRTIYIYSHFRCPQLGHLGLHFGGFGGNFSRSPHQSGTVITNTQNTMALIYIIKRHKLSRYTWLLRSSFMNHK